MLGRDASLADKNEVATLPSLTANLPDSLLGNVFFYLLPAPKLKITHTENKKRGVKRPLYSNARCRNLPVLGPKSIFN